LQRDGKQGISGFVMAYKEKMNFVMAHKKLSQTSKSHPQANQNENPKE
jgi:hypothetical protein